MNHVKLMGYVLLQGNHLESYLQDLIKSWSMRELQSKEKSLTYMYQQRKRVLKNADVPSCELAMIVIDIHHEGNFCEEFMPSKAIT